jgi:long-chain acyl-CoA synthetase
MNIALLLARSARLHAERPALAVGTQTVATYAELGARVARLAAGLAARLRPNDRVGLVMKNCPAYVELMFACWHAGLVAVPINAKLHPRELEYILGHAGARLCFATPDLHAAVAGSVPGMEAVIEIGCGLAAAVRRRSRCRPPRAPPRIRPGCSTPAAPPAGPRA